VLAIFLEFRKTLLSTIESLKRSFRFQLNLKLFNSMIASCKMGDFKKGEGGRVSYLARFKMEDGGKIIFSPIKF